jgi:iron(III) transport system substrate-binding protein
MADAPKSFADLLDPKWAGKMVKAHPAYSGTIMNATFQIAARPGLGLSREARQAARHAGPVGDRLAEEDRARRARHHDRRRGLSRHPRQGGRQAGRCDLSGEGTPVATSPSAVFKAAPNPNAARLFFNWMHGREGQQILIDYARQYSAHKQAVEKPASASSPTSS